MLGAGCWVLGAGAGPGPGAGAGAGAGALFGSFWEPRLLIWGPFWLIWDPFWVSVWGFGVDAGAAKNLKNSTPLQPQALLAKQASPVSARYTK